MADYKLRISIFAEQDLIDMYLSGTQRWGKQQAVLYYNLLCEHLESLCENPFLYPSVDDIRKGYRRSVFRRHAVYYKLGEDTIDIMGVLGRQDPDSYLP